MKHLIIKIEVAIDERSFTLSESDAKEATKQAYKAIRQSLPQFTPYNDEDCSYEIED